MDFVSRLKLYLETRRISVTQFADECRIPRPTASQLLAGRNKKVSDEMIGKIHQCYPDVSVVWLMFGEGDMLNPGAENAIPTPEHIETEEDTPTEAHAPEDSVYYGKRDEAHRWEADEFANRNRKETTPKQYGFANTNRAKRNVDFANHPEEIADANTTTPEQTKPREFVFTDATNKSENPTQQVSTSQNETSTPKMGIKQFVIPSGKGKRVVGVVVYYDDHTFESFIPDEQGGRTFML